MAPASSARRATAALEVSIEICARVPAATSPSITGSTRRSSSCLVDGLGSGPRRLAADVEDRRALELQLEPVRDRGVRVEVTAAVRERVRRDVDHAHDPEVAGLH